MIQRIALKLHRFATLDACDVEALQNALPSERSYTARTDVVRMGQGNRIVTVLSGWAARYNVVKDGTRQITAFLLPGDVSNLRNNISDAITALCPTTVANISPTDFDLLVNMHPRVARAWQAATDAEESRLRTLVTCIAKLDAEQKVGHLLCDLWHRAEAVGLIQDGCLQFPATQADIADYLGLSAVHVNRTMQRLRARGLVDLKNRCLVLPDFDRLTRNSEYEPTDTGVARALNMAPFKYSKIYDPGLDRGGLSAN